MAQRQALCGPVCRWSRRRDSHTFDCSSPQSFFQSNARAIISLGTVPLGSVLLPNWVPYCDTHARGPYSLVKIGEGWGGWVSAERYRCIEIPYDFHHSLRTFRSNSVRILPEFPMILGGGVGGSGILFIGWVGSPGWCRSKVGTPAKEHNPGDLGRDARAAPTPDFYLHVRSI